MPPPIVRSGATCTTQAGSGTGSGAASEMDLVAEEIDGRLALVAVGDAGGALGEKLAALGQTLPESLGAVCGVSLPPAPVCGNVTRRRPVAGPLLARRRTDWASRRPVAAASS